MQDSPVSASIKTANKNKSASIFNPPSSISTSDLGDGQVVISQWEKFLNLIEKKNSTIAALLRSAKPTRGDRGKVVVEVYYRFHQEQLTNPKILNLIQDVLSALSLGFVEFEFVLKENEKPKPKSRSIETIMHKPQLAKVAAEVLT